MIWLAMAIGFFASALLISAGSMLFALAPDRSSRQSKLGSMIASGGMLLLVGWMIIGAIWFLVDLVVP